MSMADLTHLDLFSGYGGFALAMGRAGFRTAAFAENEPFSCTILKRRWPQVPNLGDVTADDFIQRAAALGPFDIVTFGSPCQGFSVAGRRLGLDDPRSNLILRALDIVRSLEPRWFVLENVPGILSHDRGRTWGLFLRFVDELGYSGCWRSFDAQYAGLAQRRERVFFVGCSGGWRGPAAVLFEPESMRRHPPPRRETGQGFTHDVAPSLGASGRGFERAGETRGQDQVIAMALNGHGGSGRMDGESETFVAHALRADGFDVSEDGTGRGTPIIAIQERAVSENIDAGPQGKGWQENIAYTLEARNKVQAVAFDMRGREGGSMPEGEHATANIRAASGGSSRSYVAFSAKDHGADAGDTAPMLRASVRGADLLVQSGVRRLTPRECERLQGLPDDWTLVPHRGKPAADGPRYKALGNGVAIPVVEWIAQRIARWELESGVKRARPH